MEESEQPRKPLIPCSAAMAAMGVPARRWTTRTDLLKQLQKAQEHLDATEFEDVSVGTAAAAAGLSMHHFLRLFREVHGVTPGRYLTCRRIEVAKRLLAESELSAGEIALEVGIANASAFSRLFRAHVGVPPLVYRLTQRT